MKYIAVVGVLDIRLYESKNGWNFVASIVRTGRGWKAFDPRTRRVIGTGTVPYQTVAIFGIDAVTAVENPITADALHNAA